MAAENNTEKVGKTYIYKRCLPCGIKLHVDSYTCWKCGKRVKDMTYGSENPNDLIFNIYLNKTEKCFSCFNTQHGKTCKYIFCFGSGRGNCGICNNVESARFNCCQEIQAEEKKLEVEYKAWLNRQDQSHWIVKLFQRKVEEKRV